MLDLAYCENIAVFREESGPIYTVAGILCSGVLCDHQSKVSMAAGIFPRCCVTHHTNCSGPCSPTIEPQCLWLTPVPTCRLWRWTFSQTTGSINVARTSWCVPFMSHSIFNVIGRATTQSEYSARCITLLAAYELQYERNTGNFVGNPRSWGLEIPHGHLLGPFCKNGMDSAERDWRNLSHFL